jgi:DNA invertase Pin-like site-specific DNA recombinase
MRTAISYTRFSDPKQHGGDSVGRQSRDFAAFCERHRLTPATESFHDAGRSRFKGAHRLKGALVRFEKLVKAGEVPRGTVHVVEAWDRLSRERPDRVIALISNILSAGVDIGVTRLDDIFTEEDLGTHKFTTLSVFVQLAHQESRQKSERVAASWKTRRLRARADRRPTGSLPPAWIALRDGKFHLIAARAAVVARIFALAASGYGSARIVRTLTEEESPRLGNGEFEPDVNARSSAGCGRSLHLLILRDRRVVGEFQPRTADDKPDGPPIPGYFPRRLPKSSSPSPARDGNAIQAPFEVAPIHQHFPRLARDADTKPYRLHNKGTTKRPNSFSSTPAGRRSANAMTLPFVPFETAFLSKLREVEASKFSLRRRAVAGKPTRRTDGSSVLSPKKSPAHRRASSRALRYARNRLAGA